MATQFFSFSPRTLGKIHPIWRAYFSKGLKPPTRKGLWRFYEPSSGKQVFARASFLSVSCIAVTMWRLNLRSQNKIQMSNQSSEFGAEQFSLFGDSLESKQHLFFWNSESRLLNWFLSLKATKQPIWRSKSLPQFFGSNPLKISNITLNSHLTDYCDSGGLSERSNHSHVFSKARLGDGSLVVGRRWKNKTYPWFKMGRLLFHKTLKNGSL